MMFTDLPYELESEILSRVPATSLKELETTCKRWYALFKDLRFIKKNFSKGATHMILKKDHNAYPVRINLHGINNSFDPSIEFTGVLKSLKDSKHVMISKIFHCGGLLLCTTEDNRLVVWNPCTGQTRWIKRSISNIVAPYSAFFLGHVNNNNSCNSYKILRINYTYQKKVFEFEIYEFSSDSWRLLDDVTKNWSRLSRGVSLNGNTYWVASNRKDQSNNKFLLRFDFARETFESQSLPFQSTYLDMSPFLSVVREEKLSLLLVRLHVDSFLEMKIWMSDTKMHYCLEPVVLSKFLKITSRTSGEEFLIER